MNDHDFNKLQRTFIVAVAAYNVDSHEASYEVLLDKQLTQQKPQLKSLLSWNDSFKCALKHSLVDRSIQLSPNKMTVLKIWLYKPQEAV